METGMESLKDVIEHIPEIMKGAQWLYRIWEAIRSADKTPDEINAQQREFLAFQGRLVALEVGMRRLVAWSQNSDHDVKEGISAISRHFKENANEAAEGIRRTYPEYDQEMAETLVHHIAESLENFLPIRMSGGIGSTAVSGSVTLTPSKRDKSTDAG